MNAQQMLDVVISPTLTLMAKHGKYDTRISRMLMLGTVAIESDLGLYNRQIKGPAISPFQLEPDTIKSTIKNWDKFPLMIGIINQMSMLHLLNCKDRIIYECEANHRVACLIARGKYAMDPFPFPEPTDNIIDDFDILYSIYKRVYNTLGGASTHEKWMAAILKHGLLEVDYNKVVL